MQTVQVFNSDKKLVATFDTKAEAEAYVAKNQHLVLESSDQQVVRGMFEGSFKFLVIGLAVVAYVAYAFMAPSDPNHWEKGQGDALTKQLHKRDALCKAGKRERHLPTIAEYCDY